jgi:hypothetical protein
MPGNPDEFAGVTAVLGELVEEQDAVVAEGWRMYLDAD